MTKEELEKEAEEKYNERLKQNGIKVEYRNGTYVDGYMDSAEPREKRIAELEAVNKRISDECHKLVDSLEKKQKEIAELKAQIEKMKNWCNCKNYQQCLIELAEQGKGMKPSECCVNCKKWEIKENV